MTPPARTACGTSVVPHAVEPPDSASFSGCSSPGCKSHAPHDLRGLQEDRTLVLASEPPESTRDVAPVWYQPPPPPGDATSALPDSWAAHWRERAEAARFAADRGAA
ncbi:hypothetical protein [Microcystis phage Mae-JY09]